VSITPILASLGVGSIAVALALQDTLANLFAGIYIAADQPIVPGDFIRLDTGQEGYLMRLGWRCSHIRIVPEGAVLVPNSRLAQSVLTNFTLPNGDAAFTVDLAVAATSDLDRVETVTLEVARDVLRDVLRETSPDAADAAAGPGGASPPGVGEERREPSVRFQGFAGGTVKLTVGMRTRADAATTRHEFIKRLRARYEREGIALA
jgi:small-conductance mechanosensitive channel